MELHCSSEHERKKKSISKVDKVQLSELNKHLHWQTNLASTRISQIKDI